jgi:hypothetical protein
LKLELLVPARVPPLICITYRYITRLVHSGKFTSTVAGGLTESTESS